MNTRRTRTRRVAVFLAVVLTLSLGIGRGFLHLRAAPPAALPISESPARTASVPAPTPSPCLGTHDHRQRVSHASLPPPALVPARITFEGRAMEVAEGELLVEAREGVEAQALVARLESELGASSITRIGQDPAWRVVLRQGGCVSDAVAILRTWPEVANATPNAIARGASDGAGRAMVARPWNVAAVDPPREAISPDVVIALLDSGVAYRDHVDARGVARARAPWLAGVPLRVGPDFVHGDDTPDDWNNHGTHIASLLVGVPGLARGATLMPIQVLDEDLVGTEAGLVAGIDWAVEHGARVINMSLAFGPGYYPSRLLDRAVSRALRAGVVLVAAAGNEGRDEVRFPAAFPGVLAVGATAPSGRGPHALRVARYSSYGAELDLLAPGGDLDTDANADGVPDGVPALTFDPRAPQRFGPWLFAGTSQAAAHASAAAAHLLAAGVAAPEVPASLREGAMPLSGGRGFDPREGAGALDITRALERSERGGPDDSLVRLTARFGTRGGARVATAGVLVFDGEGTPRRGATVYGRWRGAAWGSTECVTDARGVCWVESDALEGPAAVASFEVAAIADRAGRVVRPFEAFLRREEVDPAAATLDGNAPGVLVWRDESSSTPVYLLRGLVADSALAPTIVLLDGPAFEAATSNSTGGTGIGSSSWTWYILAYDPSWFLGPLASTGPGGTGIGSSSFETYFFIPYFYGLFPDYASAWSSTPYGASYGAITGAHFVPGEILGAAVFARAASTGSTRGAGRGVPAP